MTLDENQRFALMDRNFRLASAEMFAETDDGGAFETRHVHAVSCGYPVADFNWAFLKFPDCDVAAAADSAETYFETRKLPFRFVVRDALADGCAEILEARDHRRVEKPTPGLSLDPLVPAPAPPGDLEIRRVDDEASLEDFQKTAFVGFGFPGEFGKAFLTAGLVASPDAALCVGYREGVPVATSMLVATGRVAGVYWVATLEDHRGRGYGEALTWAALEAGRGLGCTLGNLQASEMGRPVYLRMGFEHSCDYVAFQRPSEA